MRLSYVSRLGGSDQSGRPVRPRLIGRMGAFMGEEHRAVRVNENGEVETKFGFEISAGPRTYRLLITYPLAKEGLIEEIPCDVIESIDRAKPGIRGEPPEIVEGD